MIAKSGIKPNISSTSTPSYYCVSLPYLVFTYLLQAGILKVLIEVLLCALINGQQFQQPRVQLGLFQRRLQAAHVAFYEEGLKYVDGELDREA